jgi:hypothetical protein
MPAMAITEMVLSERVKRWILQLFGTVSDTIRPLLICALLDASHEFVNVMRNSRVSVEPKTKGTISRAAIRDQPDRILESWMCS